MTILVLIDALNIDDVSSENTPFLNSLYKPVRVEPSPGFCERTEIFCGLDGVASGKFCAYVYNGVFETESKKWGRVNSIESTVYQFFSYLPRFELFVKLRAKLLKLFYRVAGVSSKHLIPYTLLNAFSLSEDGEPMERWAYEKTSTLFEELSLKGLTYDLSLFTALGGESSISLGDLDAELQKLENKGLDFIAVYVADVDRDGHEFGPNSEKTRETLQEVDRFCNKIYDRRVLCSDEDGLLFLGDHGMSSVSSYVDVEQKLLRLGKKIGLKLFKDYWFFLDSTICRVWTKSPENLKNLSQELHQDQELINQGKLIMNNQYKENKIPQSRELGDMIWWANEGTVIWPDFFRSSLVKGMHGYQIGPSKTYGSLMSTNKFDYNNIKLSEIKNLITSKQK